MGREDIRRVVDAALRAAGATDENGARPDGRPSASSGVPFSDDDRRLAIAQGVGALLVARDPGLRREPRLTLAQNLLLEHEARRAAELLDGAGVRSMVLKGAGLAERLYGSSSLRPMGDVDLLVAATDFPRAVDRLRSDGMTVLERTDHAWPLGRPGVPQVLELHRSLTSVAGLFPFDFHAAFARGLPWKGGPARALSDEDSLVSLSLHAAFQHGLALRLIQWVDLARLMARPLSSSLLDEIVRRSGSARAVGATLLALSALSGDRSFRERSETAAFVGRVPAWLRRRIERSDGEPGRFLNGSALPVAPLLAVRAALLDGVGPALTFVSRSLIPDRGDGQRDLAATARRAARLLRRHARELFSR